MVWISSFRGFTAKLILDPEQQVVDASVICVHQPIISEVLLLSGTECAIFFSLAEGFLIKNFPAPFANFFICI